MLTTPPLEGPQLLGTQVELVSGTTAAGTLYGIAFTLYCLLLHASLPRHSSHYRTRQAQFMIAYSTIIMICGLYYLVMNAWAIQDAYINHSNFRGGPLAYENSMFHTQPAVTVGFVCQFGIDALTAAMQIWRLWVVWSGTRYARLIIILPILSLWSFAALQITLIVLETTLPYRKSLQSQEISQLGSAVFAIRGTVIVLPTILIAGFLTFESRRQCKLIGTSPLLGIYSRVVAILVESFAVESIWTIVLAILYSIEHPAAQFFIDTLPYIEIIAYLLILYRLRLATRRAYGTQKTYGPQINEFQNISISVHFIPTDAQSFISEESDSDIHSPANLDVVHPRGLPV